MTTVAQYLLVISSLERSAGTPVSTGRIANAVDRSPSTTTEAVKRLESRGFVEHEPYAGVTLTDRGRTEAADLRERYAILCRFYREVLEVEDYEHEAMQAVGVVSDDVTARLEATLLPPADATTANECGDGTGNDRS